MSKTDNRTGAPASLSTPKLRKTPPRPLTPDEVSSLKCIADVLIPPGEELPSGSGVANVEAALSTAAGIMSKYFTGLEATLAAHRHLPSPANTAEWLRALHSREDTDDSFWIVSTIIVVMYVDDARVRAVLNYPIPHRNPPGLTEAADDLEDGILMPVLERGEIFVPTPA